MLNMASGLSNSCEYLFHFAISIFAKFYGMTLYIVTFSHVVRESNVTILGGGWAGLLVAKRLIENGIENISILEAAKEGDQGGLLRSEVINGFTFDCGGPHLLFSRDKKILSHIIGILDSNCHIGTRKNFVFYKNQNIPYPFENGVYQLPPEERVKFIKGIIERMIFSARNENWKPKNFLDWILGFFGEYIADEYLIPYNEKIWKRKLDMMAADWVFSPGRLPFPELQDMLMTVAGIPKHWV
jgi:protoporphyrinogen oxidase